jgi:hypothetical protein
MDDSLRDGRGDHEWERLIIRVGTNCGVSLPHEALSSEGLYE